ncbi:MAG: UDP-2,3-diacylglucosamine diphosphatase LpxI [Elusimicrobia bacterium]|nr:UDP-2,3-diacylglucosamine diphosphatase LpxI [Elusimicrobiota bacterium]
MILGLIAGGGSFPLEAARKARAKGAKVVSVGYSGITDPALEQFSDAHQWLALGQLSKLLRFFKTKGVQGVLLAGSVDHTQALNAMDTIKTLADPRALKLLFRLRERKSQPILLGLIEEIESEGMKVLPSYCYLEDELVKPGVLTQRRPTSEELQDIQSGWKAAKTLAGLDIGLTCCVRRGAMVAVEALEGTDQCILRAGEILRAKLKRNDLKFTVVKVARPKQDPRYDLPVLGPRTVLSAHQAGASCIAVEAGWTLLFERQEVLNLANKHEIAITGIDLLP